MISRSNISVSNRQPAFLMMILAFLIHLPALISGNYGIYRDELYYLACASHPAFGYIDHPPFSIWMLGLWGGIFGKSVSAIRLLPALLHAVSAFYLVRIAARLGGGRFAQYMTGVALATSPLYLGLTAFYSMNALDMLFWAVSIYLFVCILGGGVPADIRRYWLILGVVLGFGLLNKISILWLGISFGVGLLATRSRSQLRTPWPWFAVGIAFLIFLPHIIWQMAHGWPTLDFIASASDKNVSRGPLSYLLRSARDLNPMLFLLWLPGVFVLGFSSYFTKYRALAWVWPVVYLILVIQGAAKPYYLAWAFLPVIAAGSVWLAMYTRKMTGGIWVRTAVMLLVVVMGLALAPFGLPVLKVDTLLAYQKVLGLDPGSDEATPIGRLSQVYSDMQGWEDLAATVAAVVDTLPEPRDQIAVFGQNYGHAGAIDYYRAKYNLPQASSGHNSYSLWGLHPPEPSVLVIINYGVSKVEYELENFEEVTLAAIQSCPLCMPYESQHKIYVVRKPRRPIQELYRDACFYR